MVTLLHNGRTRNFRFRRRGGRRYLSRSLKRRVAHADRRRPRRRPPLRPPAALRARPIASTSADIHLAEGEFLVHEGDARALFVVISGKIELSKTVTARARDRRPRAGHHLRRGAHGLRHPDAGDGARVETSGCCASSRAQYHALAAASPDSRPGWAGSPPSASAGCRGSPPSPRNRRSTVVGNRWDPASHDLKRFLVAQPDPLRVADASTTPTSPSPGRGEFAGRGPVPGAAARRRHHARPPRHPRRSPARSASAPTPSARGLRHGHHRRRPGRPRRRGLRRLGGPEDAGRRARGAGRAGRDLLADRELPRLPQRHLRRRARQPRAAPGPPPRRRDPGHPQGDRSVDPVDAHHRASTAARRSARAPSSSRPASTGAGSRSTASTG